MYGMGKHITQAELLCLIKSMCVCVCVCVCGCDSRWVLFCVYMGVCMGVCMYVGSDEQDTEWSLVQL